jgi:hypothetical protein
LKVENKNPGLNMIHKTLETTNQNILLPLMVLCSIPYVCDFVNSMKLFQCNLNMISYVCDFVNSTKLFQGNLNMVHVDQDQGRNFPSTNYELATGENHSL